VPPLALLLLPWEPLRQNFQLKMKIEKTKKTIPRRRRLASE